MVAVSRREAEVLSLLGARLSNAEIARQLHISVRTVENHVSSLLRKYQVTDRRELGAIAATTPSEPGTVTGLPMPPTSFVGRAHERDAVIALLREARLVTLTGPGGVGKTRLASVIAAATTLDGAFVELVPVRGDFVAQAVAAVLGVGEGARQPLLDAIVDRLRRDDEPNLLVLDSCEHVIESAAGFVQRVLASSPRTTILATSRERLGVPGERVFPVTPLPLASDAERLFVERASAADPSFAVDMPAVAALCARLDGIPLAIELAAARAASLGVDGLLAALEGDLRVVAGGRQVDERHRSLHAVIDWSHDLLEPSEREFFRRLAVFAGGFDLDAAAFVCTRGDRVAAADLLGRLVDKSLVVRLAGVGRWALLETIRAFALAQLDISSELLTIEARHLAWSTSVAESLLLRSGGDLAWYDDFDPVADDLRAALANASDTSVEAHQLARALGRLTFARRFLTEALEHFEAAARRAPDGSQAAVDLRSAAAAAFAVAPASRAYALLLSAADRAGAAGDGSGVAVALSQAVVTACRFPSGFVTEIPHAELEDLLREACAAAGSADPFVVAQLAAASAWCASGAKYAPDPALAEVALAAAREVGDPALISAGLDALGAVASRVGDVRAGYRISTERLAILPLLDRSDPSSAAEILDTFHGRWLSALAVGDLRAALETAEAVRRDDLLGVHPYRAVSKLVPPLVLTGRFADALELAPEMYAAWQRSGTPVAAWMTPALAAVALVHGLDGADGEYAVWMARAEAATGGNPLLARAHAAFLSFVETRVAIHRGSSVVKPALTYDEHGRFETYAIAAEAELAVVLGAPDAAARLDAVRAAGEQNDWAAACLTRARARLTGDEALVRSAAEQFDRLGASFERACTQALLPG